MTKIIIWLDNDLKSIKKAEKKKSMLENKGYELTRIWKDAYNQWNLEYNK